MDMGDIELSEMNLSAKFKRDDTAGIELKAFNQSIWFPAPQQWRIWVVTDVDHELRSEDDSIIWAGKSYLRYS